jgi:MOSC domain-containing protein YiiM
VTSCRIPCANFERFWGVPQLVKRFTARGARGAPPRGGAGGGVGGGARGTPRPPPLTF